MTFLDIILLAIGVSMDAFAVSIAKGLSLHKPGAKHYGSVALWFGGFQFTMPLIGYYLGVHFAPVVEYCDHWIAFVLLAIVGSKMLYDTLSGGDEEESTGSDFRLRTMCMLAVATSIDALAIGVSLAFLQADIWRSVAVIGTTTAFFSAFGLYLGNIFGNRYKQGASVLGGVVLILIGAKILIEHLTA
jgi:putative Mn2+ efflux pump MntP